MATGSTTSSPRGDRPRSQQTGARSAGGGDQRKKKGGAWLWWLLGLLALVLLAILLISLLGGDDDEQSATATPTPTPSAQSTPEPATGAPAGAAGAGTLTARNESLLPVPAGGLGDFETEQATGQGVSVQSVVKDEGFWVGSSAEDRVYVEYGGDVGADETQGFEPKVGDKVDLTGELRPAPENPGQTLNLPDQAARQVSRQGAYVNADSVQATP